MSKSKTKISAGVTLIEIIVGMAIMSIVILSAYTLMLFGNKINNKNILKHSVQSTVRSGMDAIISEIRNSSKLSIISSETAKSEITANEDNDYIYYEDGSIKIAQYNSDISEHKIRTLSSNLLSNGTIFSRINDYTIEISIAADDGTETYSTSSQIVLKNMQLNAGKGTIDGTTGMSALRYSVNEDVNMPASGSTFLTTSPTITSTSSSSPTPSPTPAPTPMPIPLEATIGTEDSKSVIINFNKIIIGSLVRENYMECTITLTMDSDYNLKIIADPKPKNNKSLHFSVIDIDGGIHKFKITYKNSGWWQELATE